MVNKTKNDIVALIVVAAVIATGVFLIFWFYSVVSTPEIRPDDAKKTLEIRDSVIDKITSQNDQNTPLLLEGNDFGRENPFGKIN